MRVTRYYKYAVYRSSSILLMCSAAHSGVTIGYYLSSMIFMIYIYIYIYKLILAHVKREVELYVCYSTNVWLVVVYCTVRFPFALPRHYVTYHNAPLQLSNTRTLNRDDVL